jgi:hypothetical protein
MSIQTDAPPDAVRLSYEFVAQFSRLQDAVVRAGMAGRAHLAELRRPIPAGPHGHEVTATALRLTAGELEAALAELEPALLHLRAMTRPVGRALAQGAAHGPDPAD